MLIVSSIKEALERLLLFAFRCFCFPSVGHKLCFHLGHGCFIWTEVLAGLEVILGLLVISLTVGTVRKREGE